MRAIPPCEFIATTQGWYVVERNGTIEPTFGRNVLHTQPIGDLPRDKSFMIFLMFNYVVNIFYVNIECCGWINDFHLWFLICC
jgi:hypothetical protein